MVKKRVRDPEVLPEAPVKPTNGEDDSGSDDVSSTVNLTIIEDAHDISGR
jgi:hypothetical protein